VLDFLKPIYSSLVAGYEEGFEMTQDEIEINFADQYYFSEYELKLLAHGKKDKVSLFIQNEMLNY
jgi:hypothetical protein